MRNVFLFLLIVLSMPLIALSREDSAQPAPHYATATRSHGLMEATRIIEEATQRAIDQTLTATAPTLTPTATIPAELQEATSTRQTATQNAFNLTLTAVTLTPTPTWGATRIFGQLTQNAIDQTATAQAVTSTAIQERSLRNENLLDDSSFLTGMPCGAPCWQGIIPGETSWDDALAIIEDSEDYTDLETRQSEETNVIGAIWSPAGGESCCQMYSEDGEIVDIMILQTAPNDTMGDVVEVFGDPTYLIGETLNETQGVFTLFYPDDQMLIYVFIAGENGEISATSEVIGFAYFSENRMELLTFTNDLHEWDGYQSYRSYMYSNFEVTPSVTLTPRPDNE